MSSCRELDSNRSALSAASAFAIATAGANEGTPTKEKYRRMSLASTGTCPLRCSLRCCLVLFLVRNGKCQRCLNEAGQPALVKFVHVCDFAAGFPTDQRNGDKEFVIRRAATNRVLNVLRHWVSKHSPVKASQHAFQRNSSQCWIRRADCGIRNGGVASCLNSTPPVMWTLVILKDSGQF